MVRPTSSKVRNVELQTRATEQVQRAIQSPEFPGKVMAEIHGELIVEVPEKNIDKAREFIARIQAKDEAYHKEVQDGWVVSPEPQFVHLGCSKAKPGLRTVVIRMCPCPVASARDGKEPYCVACRLIVHTLNMGEP